VRKDGTKRADGFTLIEILLAIMVISTLASVGYVTTKAVQQNVKDRKLESDVAAANAAVQLYQANGGSLAPTSSANDVITQLKNRADASSASKTVGLTGSFLDVRAEPVWQTAEEGASGALRVTWNASAGVFVLSNTGAAGIKEFRINSANAAATPTVESRVPVKDAATETKWVWDYTTPTNTVLRVGVTPGTVASGSTAMTGTASYQTQLASPTISPTGGGFPLISFDLPVTISNPNPSGSSQIYYAAGGTWSLYTGGINVAPGTTVQAVAVTLDPNSYVNSQAATPQTYTATPVTLAISLNNPAASLTYAQAGGVMTTGTTQTPSPMTVSLTSASQIPSKYITSSKFQIYYTRDGSNPLTSGTAAAGPSFNGSYASPSISVSLSNWGSASSLTVSAAAKALDTTMFANSSVVTATVGITPTALAAPTIDPATGVKATDLPVSIALASGQNYPVGARIYYTIDGSDPGNSGGNPTNGTLYTGSFNSGSGTNGIVVVTARAYGPAGYGQWFTPSTAIANTYTAITLPDGALVGSATLNGTFVGSLVYASPTAGHSMSDITFNGGAKILSGNLYLPGTPIIKKSNGTIWSVANDSLFSAHILGWEFNSSGVKTVQTTPRVIDETGSVNPANYVVMFNTSSQIEGKVIRRHDSPAFPTIAPPPAADSNGNASLNSAPAGPLSASQYSTITLNTGSVGDVRLLAGHYNNLTANNGTAFVLGDPAHPDITQVYSFTTLTLNSASNLKIVGKVIITVSSQININVGSTIGNSAHPEWLQLQFSAGNLTANSGSYVYGQLVVPTGSVTFNAGSTFTGSVTAQSLTLNSNSVVFDLPPVIQN